VQDNQGAGYPPFGTLIALSLALAQDGHFDQALRICDETLAAAQGRSFATVRWRGRPGLGEQVVRLAELAREQILEFQQDVAEAGIDITTLHSRATSVAAADPGGGPGQPPWPALAGPSLLWWPRAEYLRVVRQVPDLRAILGATWRAHTATVEATLAAASINEPGQFTLMPAEFGRFAHSTCRAPRPIRGWPAS
jgi:hypothetical protein